MPNRNRRRTPIARNADLPRCEATGKVGMPKAHAQRAARTINSTQLRDEAPVHAYRCPECGLYHTGHVPTEGRKHRPSKF
jgi:hypothetical protein